MTIDGFLQFLGLVVAVYALFGVVNRYRLRLLGWWLLAPTLGALFVTVYLLLFDVIGAECDSRWCSFLELSPTTGLTPSTLSFLVVLAWLIYVAALTRWKSIGTRHLPLLAALVDRLGAEKRFPELVHFIEPHVELISRCARRQFPLQKLRDAIRWQGKGISPWFRVALVGQYHRGILLGLRIHSLVLEESEGAHGAWRLTDLHENAETTKAYLIGYVRYDDIEQVDWYGDEYYNFPHIFCHFSHGGQPYERLAFCERKSIRPKHYFYTELASYEEVKLTSQKFGTSKLEWRDR